MPTLIEDLVKYPLPAFLAGRCDPVEFHKWINNKADTLRKRDMKHGKPYALNSTKAQYKEKVYSAICNSGDLDPYTGDLLAWELIGTWDTSTRHTEAYKRKFALMPTIDHSDPDVLDFEICSWLINECKTYLTPAEFIALCQKVVTHHQ